MIKWICPFCNHSAVIDNLAYHENEVLFIDIMGEEKVAINKIIECPNPGCNKYTFYVSLHNGTWHGSITNKIWEAGPKIKEWNLIPPSKAKPFPNYIPKPILTDYEEACLIKDLSPKSSATLARRCLQGMIRDFWRVEKDNLFEEIKAIENKVEPQTWKAIDTVREVGNIGAHMEKDINLIIEVEPREANLLINLIEILMKDWYINKHEREETLKEIAKLGKQKEVQKKMKK